MIFTNQDSAIIQAVACVLPSTVHRICLWHVFQNAKKHLGDLFRRDGNFGKDFSNCVRGFETTEEFEAGWVALLNRYNLQQNDWMQRMYNKREIWVPVYFHNHFYADISTTQRSESINKFFKVFLNRNMLFLGLCSRCQ